MAHDSKGEGHDGEHKHAHKKHHHHALHAEHEHEEGWIVSFADNVLLMMGFFVILLALNMKEPTTGGIGGVDGPYTPQPSRHLLDMVIAIREAFHSPIDMASLDPREAPLRRRMRERMEEEDPTGKSIRPGPDGVKHNLESTRPSDYVVPTAVIPFEFGSSELSEAARHSARKAAHEIAGKLNLIIEVRGNVSAAESKRDQVKGYQLSYQRAMTVATILNEEGVPWKHMRLVACSDGMPVKARADTFGEHRTNQRVELVVIQERPEPDQFNEGDQ